MRVSLGARKCLGTRRGAATHTLNVPKATEGSTLKRLILRRDVNGTSMIKKEKKS